MNASGKRNFLFLQGPQSPFLSYIADNLIAMGHKAYKINLCFGDKLFWKHPNAVSFRGRREAWPAFIEKFLDEHRITDIMFLGDQRPYHQVAKAKARERGIRVIVTELGYLRPDWVTMELDGMSTYSRFPRDPAAIKDLAEKFPEPDFTTRYPSSFWQLAMWDLGYNLSNVFLWFLFPHYRWHAIYHPLTEYFGWVRRSFFRSYEDRKARHAIKALIRSEKTYYVLPLQLQTDYQIRAHSPYPDMVTPARQVIESFARYAPPDSRLVVKVHPMDSGMINWRNLVERTALGAGVPDRVIYIDGGNLDILLRQCRGVVTVNSTVGTAALQHMKPLVVLGNAIFDIPGLAFQGHVNRFWTDSGPPDRELLTAFYRALAGTTQIKGGYYTEEGLRAAAEEAAKRLDGTLYELPEIPAAKFPQRSAPRPTVSRPTASRSK